MKRLCISMGFSLKRRKPRRCWTQNQMGMQYFYNELERFAAMVRRTCTILGTQVLFGTSHSLLLILFDSYVKVPES